jgi:hypothetical protein
MSTNSGLLFFLSVLFLTACTSPSGPDEGTYTATITGEIDTTYSGRAELERGRGLDEFEYAVHMFLPDHGPEYGIFLFFPDRPTAGTYQIVTTGGYPLKSDEVSAAAIIQGTAVGTSGEVRITSSDPLRGTFEFVEHQPALGPEPQLQVRGEFTLR